MICTDVTVRNVVVGYVPDLGEHSIVTCESVFRKGKVKPTLVTYRPFKNILQVPFNIDLEHIP